MKRWRRFAVRHGAVQSSIESLLRHDCEGDEDSRINEWMSVVAPSFEEKGLYVGIRY